MTPFLAHSTPFRSHRSLSKVSTNSGEAHPCDVRQQRTGAVAKSPRCHRAPTSIRQAAPSICREGPSLAGLLRIGLTIDLIPGRAQTGDAIPVHVTFPRENLFDREL